MAAKAPEAPPTESARIAKERRKLALEEAKKLREADVGLFGDISVVFVPPDPAKEEPPADEPLSEEDKELQRAYQDAASPASIEDVAAVEVMAGAVEEGPSAEDIAAYERGEIQELTGVDIAEELEAAHEALEDAVAAQAGREAFVEHVLDPLAQAIAEDVAEILGPDSFGGEDGLPAPSAETLRRQIAEDAERIEKSAGQVLAETDRALESAEAAEAAVVVPAMADQVASELGLAGAPTDHECGADCFHRSHFPDISDAEYEEKLAAERKHWSVPGPEGPAGPPSDAAAPGGFALFGHNLFGDEVKAKSSGPLSVRFKLPPFTVFDARQGIWQDRKRAWLSLGIQSEVGRGENLLNMSDTVLEPDPVKRAEMIRQREKKNKPSAFGQEFILGAQPGIDGKPGGQGKAWHTNDTGISRKLAPGGGGGGAWIGGPKTSSSEKFGREGEDDVVLDENGQPLASKTGTSIFDPVLTELLYSWFVPPAGDIFDPFAGGSVRGVVASKLGRRYVGIELRAEQIVANERQAAKICGGDAFQPTWIEGDSTNAAELTEGALFDFVIACPPYGDLEQYSEDPRDLSNMTYEAFSEAYAKIIAAALARLKPDRFACFVIGDIRDKEGFYRGLPELTVRCFGEAGARKYNEAVLVTSVGSLPIRISKQFGRGRKLGKTHQNVLGFCKGDPFRAAEACGGQAELTL
jgi:hypothetical protein